MTDVLTPPLPAGQPPQQPGRRRDGAWVAILLTVIGAAVIVAVLAVGVLTGFRVSPAQVRDITAAVDGVDAVSVDFSSADVTVAFGDVAEATLRVTSQGWTGAADPAMTVSGGTLSVTDGEGWRLLPNFGGWTDRSIAILTLPRELEGVIDLRTDMSAGSIAVSGDFRDVQLWMSAGQTRFTGGSAELSADVSAGRLIVDTAGPSRVRLSASAGEIVATVRGAQPDTTSVDVAAGPASVMLPHGAYAVSGDASAGSRSIDVSTDPEAAARLHVTVSAGSARVGYVD